MSKMIIVEGNSNDKDNVRAIMVKGEKGEQGDLNHNDIVDNLTSTATNKVLSAKQGKTLKNLVDINTANISANSTMISNETSARQSADTTLQNNINSEATTRASFDTNLQNQISSLANGSPLVASSTSGMTDTSKIYVLTTDGHWYYYNGTAWTDGGVYQATSIGQNSIGFNELTTDLKNHIKVNIATYTITEGIYIQKSNLTDAEHALFCETSPIELKIGQTISFNGKGYNTNVSMVTICDSTGSNRSQGVVSIDSTTRKYEFTAIKDCYVIISSQTSELSNVIIITDLISKEDLPDNLSTVCTYIDSYNLPEPTTLTDDSYVILEDGNISEYNGLKATNFIEVLPLSIKVSCTENITTSPKNLGVCFYDKNKDFISSTEYTREAKVSLITIPTNTKFIRYTVTQNMTSYGYKMEYTSFKEYINYINNYIQDVTETKEEKYAKNLFTSFIKFGVVGDSLASGESVANNGGTTQYIDNYDYSWGQFIARNHGMTCINFSKGGATTRSWLNPANDWGITKLLNSQNLCNAYIIGLGVNDAGISDYLGTINDMHDDYTQNADTFYGNYGKIIGNIKTIAPKAKIFIFTVPNDWGEYNTAIRNIANHYNENVYLIDLYNLFNNEYYGNDTFITNNRRVGHYNAIGYNYMSELLFMELSKYMYENYEEFKQIEFINTNYSYNE